MHSTGKIVSEFAWDRTFTVVRALPELLMICGGYSSETAFRWRVYYRIYIPVFFLTQPVLSPLHSMQWSCYWLWFVNPEHIELVTQCVTHPLNGTTILTLELSFKRNASILRSFENLWHWMNADYQCSHSWSMDLYVSYRTFSSLRSPCSWSTLWEGEFQHGPLTHPLKTH